MFANDGSILLMDSRVKFGTQILLHYIPKSTGKDLLALFEQVEGLEKNTLPLVDRFSIKNPDNDSSSLESCWAAGS